MADYDEQYYHDLAAWAETTDFNLEGGKVGQDAVESSREVLRRASSG